LHLDALDGPMLAQEHLAPDTTSAAEQTGDPPSGEGAPRFQIVRIEGWTDVPLSITPPDGRHDLYVIFRGPATDTIAKFDWLEFHDQGRAD
jgi:hypothetical protein